MTCISRSTELLGQTWPYIPPEATDYIKQYLVPQKLTPLYYRLGELQQRDVMLKQAIASSTQILRMSWEIPSLAPWGVSHCVEQLDSFFRTAQGQSYYMTEEHIQDAINNTRSRLEAAPSDGSGSMTVSAYADPNTYIFQAWSSDINFSYPVHKDAQWYPKVVAANTYLAPEQGHKFDDYFNACLALLAIDMITPAWLPIEHAAVR